ncbi:MAG: NAD(P)H-dependent oxidoreductase subunit E [Bacteroidales bacterium]|nr:NAD(P)H-dependent oxidoreductase subunit E [Bacteroidales bacterium]
MLEVANIIEAKIEQYGRERQALIPILQGIIADKNFIAKDDMVLIAKELDISAADVYGTASFFSFIEDERKGKYVIRVCKSITCDMKNRRGILASLEKELRIKLGETTHDNLFTLHDVNCIGLCDQGPAMLINDEPYTHLTVEKIPIILREKRNQKN